ncbi:MAG: hypothetical protein AAF747_02475 [Planctomycetota bacterium]
MTSETGNIRTARRLMTRLAAACALAALPAAAPLSGCASNDGASSVATPAGLAPVVVLNDSTSRIAVLMADGPGQPPRLIEPSGVVDPGGIVETTTGADAINLTVVPLTDDDTPAGEGRRIRLASSPFEVRVGGTPQALSFAPITDTTSDRTFDSVTDRTAPPRIFTGGGGQ